MDSKNEYLHLILKGYIEDKTLLEEYLIRKQKTFERDFFITSDEFYKKCSQIVHFFDEDLEKSVFKRKKELYLILGLEKDNPEIIDTIKNELKEVSKDNFTIHLMSITNGNFSGHLWSADVNYIRTTLNAIHLKNSLATEEIKGQHFTDFEEFINYYKNQALETDLSEAGFLVVDNLKNQKNKLNYADLKEEILEVSEFCKKAIKEVKQRLRNCYNNNGYQFTYANSTAPFLIDLNLYFEYLELYKKAQQPLNISSNLSNNLKQETNIILKTINEVKFFKHQLLSAVVLKESQMSFFLLSQTPILDIESLKNYLFENDLNKFQEIGIEDLKNKIEACLDLEASYRKLPVEDCSYNYNFEGKMRGGSNGRIKFTLVEKGRFLKADKITFEEKEPNFKFVNTFSIGILSHRLKEIKGLFETGQKQTEPEVIDLRDTKSGIENKKGDFNPNHFNKKSFALFLYLVDSYDKKGKIKFINIFEFMKKGIDKNKYAFRFTQEKYTAFILSSYEIEIKKYKVADGYSNDEKPVLNSHEQQFDGR